MSDEIKKVVNLVSVQVNTDVPRYGGGSYKGAQVVYQDNGKVTPKGIAQKYLDSQPQLKADIEALVGKTNVPVFMHMVKSNKYWSLLEFREATKEDCEEFLGKSKHSVSKNSSSFTKTNTPEESARWARQSALQAAAGLTDNADDAIELALKFTNFILEPLSLDDMGQEIKSDE